MSMLSAAIDWCRACGSLLSAPADTCPSCKWPLVEPDLGNPAIGLCVKVSGGLRPKWGIVLWVDGDQAHVQVRVDEVVIKNPLKTELEKSSQRAVR